MSNEKEKILHAIQSREDYSYYHGIHQLTNPITGEKMLMIMNEFDLNIEEKENIMIYLISYRLFQKTFI